MRNVKNLTICVLMLVLLAAATSVAVEYEIVDLGTLGGNYSYASGINDSGQVVGESNTAEGEYRAFLWTESDEMKDLGTLGRTESYASGINDSGQVVGYYQTAPWLYHASLWPEFGGMQDLGTLGGSYSRAFGINDSGQVVGESTTAEPELHAFLWPEFGGMKDLGVLGGDFETFSVALGINDSGQVVGYSTTDSWGVRAFLWTATGEMQDLGTLGENESRAFGINDSGQVVGYYSTAEGEYHAFLLWTATGGMQDLGTLGGTESYAYGINDSGQVVGYSSTAEGEYHAFLWTESGGGMQDLGVLGTESYAWGINDSGQVVGIFQTTAEWDYHACTWIPATPCTPVSIDSLTADPLVLPLGNVVNFEATIVDGCGEIDALWDFDDGTVDPQTNVTSPVTTTKTYTSAGVYAVVLTVRDNKVDVGDNILVVVYDPTGGFVTGGGWIYSPAGAYTPDPSLTGKANFGFVSKYKKDASVPTGNTEFVFKAGDLNFHSMSYDWLVVTGSNYARFKGWGSINGYGDYRFMLWAGDDDTDTFRIKIWTEDEEGNETIIYDNGFDQGIMGGNIIIHN